MGQEPNDQYQEYMQQEGFGSQGAREDYGDDAGESGGKYYGTPQTSTSGQSWRYDPLTGKYYDVNTGAEISEEQAAAYKMAWGNRSAAGVEAGTDPRITAPNWYAGQSTAQSDQFRGNQQWLIDQLQNQIRGNGPTVAGQQFQRDLGSAIANAVGQSRSNQNISPAMQARMASMNTGAMAQNAAGQAAQMRAAEQLGAMGLMNQVAGGARGQDIGIAGSNQEAQMAAALANQRAMQWQQEMEFKKAQAAAAAEAAKKERWLRALGFASGGIGGAIQGGMSGAGGSGDTGSTDAPGDSGYSEDPDYDYTDSYGDW